MNLYVGVTDNDWFAFLRERRADEVNFWQPGGTQAFRALRPGEPFLFKLKHPHNHIAGGGFFVHHTFLPLSVAWETFGLANGLPDYASFARRIHGYRRQRGDDGPNPVIGCVALAQTFFLDEADWVAAPASWSQSIVSGKRYDLRADAEMRGLWQRVLDRTTALDLSSPAGLGATAEAPGGYTLPFLTRGRIGQGAFRALVIDAYGRRCALSGERTLPVLQASHIRPFATEGPNRVTNGLLLRADLHVLFDRGYLTVTPEHRVEVSKRIREEFENGRDYYAFDGEPLRVLPARTADRPEAAFLTYHNEHVYRP